MSFHGTNRLNVGGLGNSVFQPKVKNYVSDGSGRDVHCFSHARPIDTMNNEPPKFNTSTTMTAGQRHKSPIIPMA